MKAIKKLFLSFMVSVLLFSTLGTAFAEQNNQANTLSFVDVPKSHGAYTEIMYMAENKIINGYGNGYFGVADPITREHLAVILYRYLKPQDSANNPFVDIDGSNYKKEILAFTARGTFSVNADKKFNPKDNVTRAELAAVLVKTFDLKSQENYEFNDMKGHWANEYVKILAGNQITTGTGDGNFNPNGIVTRAQFSMFLYRTIMKVTDMQNNESVATYKEYVIQRPTMLYSEPSYLKQTQDDIYPRTVTVTEEKGNGWMKIKTSNGEKWVAPEGQKYNLQANVKMYFKPSVEEKSTGELGAQMVTLLDEQPDGWKKILTDAGTRWIAPEGINYKVENEQTLYSSPDYKSNTVGNIAPKTVKVVDFQENGWLKIQAYMGDTWIAPKGVTYELKQNVAIYRESSFLADKEEYGLMPQTVILLEERVDGWKRIKTAYGERWIVPEGVPYQVKKETKIYKDLYFTENDGVINSEKVSIIGEQPGGWYQIKSSRGTHWIAPNGIKYRTTKDIQYSASHDILSPNIGTIPNGTVINVVDNDKILWNGQYVYGFLTYFSMEPVEATDSKYTRQPSIFASLLQIKNVVTNGYDDGISEQIFNDLERLAITGIDIPAININLDFTDFNKAMKELDQVIKELEALNLEKVIKKLNDAYRLINEGLEQAIQGINQANKGMAQMNNGIQLAIQGVNQANSGLQEMNNATDQANTVMQKMVNTTNKMQKGLDQTISGVDVSLQKINSIIDAPNKAPQSDLKTIHLDFDFSDIVPTSSPEEKLRQQQRDEAMYNLISFAPFTGNLTALGELISGENPNSGADLQSSDYALNMLALVGGGEIKLGAAFFGSIGKVTKRQKFTSTKIDLSWLEKFGDKYAAHEVTGTVKVAGQTKDISRRVYRMKDIDWDYVAPPSVNESGMSNLQRALNTLSPFTKDNHKIELHHLTQKEPGAMVEIPENKHEKFTKELHGLVKSGESFRNDTELEKQYNNFKKNYWKMRAKEHLEGK